MAIQVSRGTAFLIAMAFHSVFGAAIGFTFAMDLYDRQKVEDEKKCRQSEITAGRQWVLADDFYGRPATDKDASGFLRIGRLSPDFLGKPFVSRLDGLQVSIGLIYGADRVAGIGDEPNDHDAGLSQEHSRGELMNQFVTVPPAIEQKAGCWQTSALNGPINRVHFMKSPDERIGSVEIPFCHRVGFATETA